MAKSGLNVDTGQLNEYGDYLITCKKNIEELLDKLNSKMGNITNGWKDEDGAAFKEKFSTFITDAKTIDVEIEELGQFAKKNASQYDTILSESLQEMGD